MPESISDHRCSFPSEVFEQATPARIEQGDWRCDAQFLAQLQSSWTTQYQEYLGADRAARLVDQLCSDGELFAHEPTCTLQALVDDRCVGICSMRPLGTQDQLALITMLEVDETFRQRGIGRQMVHSLEIACDHLMAHVSIHRPQVMNFYKRLGFHCLERSVVDHYGYSLDFDVVAKKTGTHVGGY